MTYEDIRFQLRRLYPHSAVLRPRFATGSILAADPWAFARIQLVQSGPSNAPFYWDQAKEFFLASQQLSVISSPLTSYYSVMNATKALLLACGKGEPDKHGVYGKRVSGGTGLDAEVCCICTTGVGPELMRLYGRQPSPKESFSLKDLLHLVPFVHRAFLLTYPAEKDLFLTLDRPRFVRRTGSTEAWFMAEVTPSHAAPGWENHLPKDFERDRDISAERQVVRSRKRFRWDDAPTEIAKSLVRICTNHMRLRKWLVPIIAPTNRWYIRRPGAVGDDLPLLVVLFALLHRLSEMSRYEATVLRTHLDSPEGWVLTEFLQVAPAQFINTVAAEITGLEFIRPDAVRVA